MTYQRSERDLVIGCNRHGCGTYVLGVLWSLFSVESVKSSLWLSTGGANAALVHGSPDAKTSQTSST